jgi:hypothetical protein
MVRDTCGSHDPSSGIGSYIILDLQFLILAGGSRSGGPKYVNYGPRMDLQSKIIFFYRSTEVNK